MARHTPQPLTVIVTMVALLPACGRREQQAQPAVATPGATHPLLDPASAEMRASAPASYRARFETSAGTFVVEITRAWAPGGADRLYNLVRHGFFDGTRFFRVVPDFVVQFGLSGDPAVSARWRLATIPDDPVTHRNTRGTVTFATAGPNTRTTQLFINYGDNTRLDAMGFAPLGTVVEGMEAVDRLYPGYGQTPDQGLIQMQGNGYLAARFPQLDSIIRATILAP
ncbi:MAG: peptidylprolyl isomerase [Gemmatimonadales bacterium]